MQQLLLALLRALRLALYDFFRRADTSGHDHRHAQFTPPALEWVGVRLEYRR